MKGSNLLKLNVFVLLFIFSCFGIKSETKGNIPDETEMEYGVVFKTANMKGILISYLADGFLYDGEEGEVAVFEFISEDGKSYNGKTIEIEAENSEREKLLKKYFKDSSKLLDGKAEYLKQPVEITATEIYVRPSSGGGNPVYYMKAAKIIPIKSTKAVFSGNMKEIEEKKYKDGEVVEINSKKGFAELKSSPSKTSETIQKIQNGEKYQIVNKFGDWCYVYSYPINLGYIYAEDLK